VPYVIGAYAVVVAVAAVYAWTLVGRQRLIAELQDALRAQESAARSRVSSP
jgi:hypothetical protein